MRPLERLSPGATIAAAVRVGKTRLIDNVPLLAGPEGG
jgi:pantothenate synthetase